MIERYNTDHPRDEHGRWSSGPPLYSVQAWANAAHHSQQVANNRRAQKTQQRRETLRGALLGAVAGLVLATLGLLANYATGGAPLW